MPVGTFVDVEGAVRAWARAHSGISAAAPGGVFFGIPDGGGSYPLLTLARVGGGPLGDEAPLDQALVQFDAWGTSARDKAGAAALAVAVVNAAHQFTDGTPMGAAAIGMWAQVELGPVWTPDPDSGRGRYVVDVAFGVRSAG